MAAIYLYLSLSISPYLSLWVVCVSVSFHLCLPVSVSGFVLRLQALCVSHCVFNSVSLYISDPRQAGGGGGGRDGNWNNRCPSQNSPLFWGLGRGQGEDGGRGCPSRSPSHFSLPVVLPGVGL